MRSFTLFSPRFYSRVLLQWSLPFDNSNEISFSNRIFGFLYFWVNCAAVSLTDVRSIRFCRIVRNSFYTLFCLRRNTRITRNATPSPCSVYNEHERSKCDGVMNDDWKWYRYMENIVHASNIAFSCVFECLAWCAIKHSGIGSRNSSTFKRTATARTRQWNSVHSNGPLHNS